MISVIIPTINDPYLLDTIRKVHYHAADKLEFIIINDGGKIPELVGCFYTNPILINHTEQLGRRVSINKGAKIATGDYLFILDSHCSMSQDWDIKMQQSCRGANLVYAVIRDMEPDTWNYRGGDYLHVRLNKEYTEKWWFRKPLDKCDVEEESMALTGCAWMITKEHYWKLGGYDESLGKYGWDGPEWACKIWMGDYPGKVILRTDVICGHIFGTNDSGKQYKCEMIPKSDYVKYMESKWGDKIGHLVERFAPVPDWTPGEKGSDIGQKEQREVKIQRKDEHITRDSKGKIVKKVIEYFEYVYKDDGKGPSEAELAEIYGPKAKKVSEEVWTLNKEGILVNDTTT